MVTFIVAWATNGAYRALCAAIRRGLTVFLHAQRSVRDWFAHGK